MSSIAHKENVSDLANFLAERIATLAQNSSSNRVWTDAVYKALQQFGEEV